ncbi:MAG TPA: zinc-dependent alcohol dehydrogenase family protein [Casimicrobiaceae bacterium]|nr:zinc-dependent alcohol dehydrogenase family protein [Casimicrobiaceae bacterium]
MRAMELETVGAPLLLVERAVPRPGPGQVLVEVQACGVCRTDLHVVDGDLPNAKRSLVPGHEIVGLVVETGSEVRDLQTGERVGIPWLAQTCGVCRYCISGRENLCDYASFTGYTVDGGYAEYALADPRFCFRLPDAPSAHALAPWLCAGLIGYRALRAAGDAKRIGIYGFGAAAHMIAQVCRYERRDVFAFARPGDDNAQQFARDLGAVWAGGSDERPPCELDAAILFAPVGALVPKALRDIAKGGIVVCAGIHMSDIPSFPYVILWGERRVCSVANLTRRDGVEFIDIAQRAGIESTVTTFPLSQANEALAALREGRLVGAAVLDTAPGANRAPRPA